MKRGRKEEGLKEEGRKGRQRATVKPLIMDPLKSRQPLYSGWLTCP